MQTNIKNPLHYAKQSLQKNCRLQLSFSEVNQREGCNWLINESVLIITLLSPKGDPNSE